jgi:hypothetical protein
MITIRRLRLGTIQSQLVSRAVGRPVAVFIDALTATERFGAGAAPLSSFQKETPNCYTVQIHPYHNVTPAHSLQPTASRAILVLSNVSLAAHIGCLTENVGARVLGVVMVRVVGHCLHFRIFTVKPAGTLTFCVPWGNRIVPLLSFIQIKCLKKDF